MSSLFVLFVGLATAGAQTVEAPYRWGGPFIGPATAGAQTMEATDLWGTPETPETLTPHPTAADPTIPTGDPAQHVNPTTAGLSDSPTAAPTSFPTPEHETKRSCDIVLPGETVAQTVDHGFKGPGEGSNWCNKCECNDGDYTACTVRECSKPLNIAGEDLPADKSAWNECDEVSCVFNTATRLTKVTHSHEESVGIRHLCQHDIGTGDCTCYCHGQETDAPTPAPVSPDPRTFSAPPAAPADTSTLAFAQFYHIDTPKITWGQGKPTLDDVLQNLDPAGLPDPWTFDDTPHAVEAKTDNRPECGWGEMESAYLVGWIWVPQGTESVWADFYTDVLSWVYVNDVLISDLDIPCCSYSRHSIAGSAFNTGEWNKFYMMGADACGGGGVGFKNMATQP